MLSKFGIRALPKPFDLDTLLGTIEQMIADSMQDRGNAAQPEPL
jgi:hypothetical protein